MKPFVLFTGGNKAALAIPTSPVAGSAQWLKADAGIGLPDASLVTLWQDQSGNAADMIQAVGANKPTFRTNQQNGLPGVVFDGVASFMQAAANLAQKPITIQLVGKNIVPVSMSAWWSGSIVSGIEYRTNAATGFQAIIQANVSQIAVGIQNIGTAANVLTMTYDGVGSWTLRRNGTPDSSGVNNVAIAAGKPTIGFSPPVAGDFLNGTIFEILVYQAALPLPSQVLNEQYLNGKWAVF